MKISGSMTPPPSESRAPPLSENDLPYFFCSYFDNIDRLLTKDYVPNEQDVLRSRVQTTGIIETSFKINKAYYRLVLHGRGQGFVG